jgi:hypothetical protein
MQILNPMKKLIILSAALLAFAATSCKKAYTCNCVTTDTYTDPSGNETYVYKNTSKAYSAKMSKKQAESACDHEETAVHSTYLNAYTDNGSSPDPTFSTNTECSIK